MVQRPTCSHRPDQPVLGVCKQVFEQVFQAYEQKLPRKQERKYKEEGWVDPKTIGPDSCPGERHLQLSYNQTAEVSMPSSLLFCSSHATHTRLPPPITTMTHPPHAWNHTACNLFAQAWAGCQ